MGNIIVGTPFNIDLEFATAQVTRRIGAVFVDMSILCLYMLLVYRFIIIGFDMGQHMNQFAMMLGISVLPYLYFPIMETLMNGQTPGKKIMGIKVMDKEGQEPSLSQYLLRWLLGFGNYSVFLLPYVMVNAAMQVFSTVLFCVLVIAIFYFPDFLCSVINSKNQRIADIAAGTVVIDVKKKMDFTETIYLDIAQEQTSARYEQVLQLSDRDINGIRNLLHKKAKSKVEQEYRGKIVARIKEALEITDNDLDDVAFLQQLLQDYNYLTQRK